jgi:hypothetical protein
MINLIIIYLYNYLLKCLVNTNLRYNLAQGCYLKIKNIEKLKTRHLLKGYWLCAK